MRTQKSGMFSLTWMPSISSAVFMTFAPLCGLRVYAADAGPPNTVAVEGLEEVTVTARRVSENLQTVPIAITVFSQERLTQLDTRDLLSIGNEIPGVQICCGATISSVRGILGGAPTYFADVPVSQTGYSNFFDVENFQVLKGPQGTLFGQAAAAGAFIFEPRKPGEKLGGYFSASGGNYGRRTIEGALDVPLLDDHLFTRLAAVSNYRQGFVHDLSNNQYYVDQDYYTVRPSVTWKITESLENYTLYQYSHTKDSGAAGWVLDDINFNPGQPSLGAYITSINGGNTAAYTALAAQLLQTQFRLGHYTVLGTHAGCASPLGPVYGPQFVSSLKPAGTACPGDWTEDNLLVNTTSWRFADHWTAKNIFHYDWSKQFQQPVSDLSPLILFQGGDPRQTAATIGPKIWSDEAQVQGTIGRFDVQVGTFHTGQKTDPQLLHNGFLLFPTLTNTSASSSSHAIYGQSDIHLNEVLEGLTATVGLRYNIDHIEQASYVYDPDTGALLGQSVGTSDPAGHATFHNVSYTAGLRYQFTPDSMVFITNSRGFSAGAFQSTPGIGYYQPQVLTNLEGGIKTTFDIGSAKARLNASYYYGWFDNVQVSVYQSFTTPISGLQSVGFLVGNAATARIQGFDAEFDLIPIPSLEVGASFAYTNNKYTKYEGLNPFTNQQFDYSGTPFLFVPKYKYGVRATYHLPIPSSIGALSLSADFSHRGTVITTAGAGNPTDPTNPDTGLICTRKRTAANGYPASVADGGTAYVQCMPTIANLDLSANWRDFLGHDHLAMSFVVTNVTRNTNGDGPADLDAVTGYTASVPAAPRMFFVRMQYDF